MNHRSRPGLCVTIVVMTLLCWGCATYQSAGAHVARAVGHWERGQVPLSDAGVGSTTATTQPATATIPGEPERSVMAAEPVPALQSFVGEALRRNPSIMAAVADLEARLERIPQVTSLPDPFLRAIVRPEPIQTAAGDVVFTLGVGQKIPWLSKLDLAGQAAAAEVRMAIEQLNATRLRIIADVERAYHRVYLADRSIELATANRQLLEVLEQVASSKYRVGKAAQQDVLRVQTEVSNLRNDEARYRRQRNIAAAALNQLLDRDPRSDVPATDPIQLRPVSGEVEQLLLLAAEHNPELAVLIHQAERDRRRIELASQAYLPDPTLGFEWSAVRGRDAYRPPRADPSKLNRKSERGDDNWALSVMTNLPIWFNRIEAAKREARQNLARTQHEHRASRNLIAFRIHDAWERVQTRQETVQLLESTLIPQAKQTYEVSLTAYQTGELEFLTVVDSWRQWLGFELMLHREMAGLETAFSDLQREVGLQLVRSDLAAERHTSEEVQ